MLARENKSYLSYRQIDPAKTKVDGLGAFLQEMGKYDLLTKEEEQTLSAQVQFALQVEELGAGLSEFEVARRLKLAAKAREKMICCNLRLVVRIAKLFQGRGVPIQDLIQEGSIGLNRAIDLFDPSRNYKFSTYAYHWISQGMTRSIGNDSRTMRLPTYVHEKLNKLKKVQRSLSQELGRTPTNNELAEAMGVTASDLLNLLHSTTPATSLDIAIGDGKSDIAGMVPDYGHMPESAVEQNAIREAFESAFTNLTDNEQKAFRLRFGLGGCESTTIKGIGVQLGMCQQRASQVVRSAVGKLRRDENLRTIAIDYLESECYFYND